MVTPQRLVADGCLLPCSLPMLDCALTPHRDASHTPTIDSLASEGLSLSNFYSVAALCTPSRAGLLTGR